MSNHMVHSNPDELALLYLAGELNGAELRTFEARLEHDAAAQEGLIQAVQLSCLLGGTSQSPSQEYRAAVRNRIAIPRSMFRFRRTALFGLAISIAIVCCLLTLDQDARESTSMQMSNSVVIVKGPIKLDPVPSTVASSEVQDDMAEVWANMTNLDHLQKSADEEPRRRGFSRESRYTVLQSVFGDTLAAMD